MLTTMKRRLSAAVEESSTPMTDRSEPRPSSVLRQAAERWRRFVCEDRSVADDGRENPPSPLEPVWTSCDAATCRHEFAESCSPNPCDVGSNTCVVCEKFVWKFWLVQACVECGVRKHHDCVAVVGVSGGAAAAASAIGSTGRERSTWLQASDVDEVVTRECTSTDTFIVRARGDVVDETACGSSDGAAGTSSERYSTPAPLEAETFENAPVDKEFPEETRAVEATSSGLECDKIECPGNDDVSTTCLERSVRATTPMPLEDRAFKSAKVVEEFSEEVRTVESISELEADKIECSGSDVVISTCSEQNVRVTTPAPLEAGHGLPSEPENESTTPEITRLESTVEIAEIDDRIVDAVSAAEVSETTVGTVGTNNDDRPLVAIDPIVRRPPTVRKEDVKLLTNCKILPRKNAYSQMKNHMKIVNRFLNKPQEQTSVDHLIKYWIMQNRLFSRFSMGILLDEESFYSVCPEVLCGHIANKCKCETIVDPFCGAGGNIIQFTKTCSRVIGVDVDAKKIKLARNNAEVYGVQNRIELRTGDYFHHDSGLRADVVFMSPPWGGPEYIGKPVYSLAGMCRENGGGRRVLEIAREIAPKIAIHLPRNLDKDECVMLARELNFKYILFENNYIGNKMNSTTMYLK